MTNEHDAIAALPMRTAITRIGDDTITLIQNTHGDNLGIIVHHDGKHTAFATGRPTPLPATYGEHALLVCIQGIAYHTDETELFDAAYDAYRTLLARHDHND